jgi:large subunit ribosomal protein L29
MKVDEIRKLNDSELLEELENSIKEHMHLRFKSATTQLTDFSLLGKVKKRIARIKTIITERELVRLIQ